MTGRPIVLQELEYTDQEVKVLTEKLLDVCSSFNITLTSRQAQDCLMHLLYVEQVNSYINLTRITDLDEAIILHLLDSLVLARYFDSSDLTYLDMGTGAGFPGIPLAIATGATGTLIDSIGKKINAVNAIIRKLQLDQATAVHTRIEEYAIQIMDALISLLQELLQACQSSLNMQLHFYVNEDVLLFQKATQKIKSWFLLSRLLPSVVLHWLEPIHLTFLLI